MREIVPPLAGLVTEPPVDRRASAREAAERSVELLARAFEHLTQEQLMLVDGILVSPDGLDSD